MSMPLLQSVSMEKIMKRDFTTILNEWLTNREIISTLEEKRYNSGQFYGSGMHISMTVQLSDAESALIERQQQLADKLNAMIGAN